jgi:signal transduction histidine kinase
MSGDELVRRLRALPRLNGTPILVLTAKADEELRVQLLRSGAQDYLMKPFASEELRARAAVLIASKRARDVLQAELASESRDVELLARDLTMRKRELDSALESARAARDVAEKESRLKTTFLNLVSHELRTPVTSLLLQVEMARRVPGDAAQSQFLPRMHATARRLADLIVSLLDYAAVESNRVEVNVSAFDPRTVAEEVREDLEAQAGLKGVDLCLAAPEDLPLLESDRRLVRIVLGNLAANAVKFTRRGTVTVLLGHSAETHSFEVRDTGPGVPAADRQRIFDPFEQVAPIRQKHDPGIGLGLAVVRQLVAALGGEVTLQSEVGRGSSFTVVLPSRAPRRDALARGPGPDSARVV